MDFTRVASSSIKAPRGRYVVYANNGKSTYRVKGQPVMTDRIDAGMFAAEYQRRYDEVTTVIYVGYNR